jgi:16S rRNA (cytidine1402-2'-O)-methyltransferase
LKLEQNPALAYQGTPQRGDADISARKNYTGNPKDSGIADKGRDFEQVLKTGIYVVATPIGNLADITLRAISVLYSADLIICEDSRNTSKLLSALAIKDKKMLTYNDQSNDGIRSEILGFLQKNKILALVSDAGTPLISDPGYKLLNFLRSQDQQVFVIPGVSALTAALCGSGIACNQFSFFGFLPPKTEAKIKLLQSLPASLTAVFFESPNRIEKTLEIISKIFPKRRVCLAREITKLYEEFLIDFPKNLLAILAKNPAKICGEMVLLIEKTQKSPFSKEDSEENGDSDYENMVSALIEEIEKLKNIIENSVNKQYWLIMSLKATLIITSRQHILYYSEHGGSGLHFRAVATSHVLAGAHDLVDEEELLGQNGGDV